MSLRVNESSRLMLDDARPGDPEDPYAAESEATGGAHVASAGGTITSSAANLAQSALGAGTLGMAGVVMSAGAAVSVFFLVATAITSVMAAWILVKVSDKMDRVTYEDIAMAVGGKALRNITAFTIALLTWGVEIIYIIAVGAAVKPFVANVHFWGSDRGCQLITFFLWLGVMLPLSLMKRINQLRYASAIGLVTLLLIVVALSLEADRNRNTIPMSVGKLSAVTALPNIFFSYCVQPNTFQIYRDLTQRSPGRMVVALALALSFSSAVYIAAGLSGAIAFGTATQSLVLANFHDIIARPFQAVALAGYTFTLLVSYPVVVFPPRDAIIQVVFGYSNVEEFPEKKRLALCLAIATSSLVVGTFFQNFGAAMDVIGGICSALAAFVFPAVFALRCNLFESLPGRVGAWTLAILGMLVGVGTTVLGIYHEISKK